MVKVSVVMPVYNGEKYLKEAMFSILNQTFRDFEFIIVDDGSTDGSRETIEAFKDERIKLLVNNENKGVTESLDKGLFWSDGEYIARQDADDVSLPNRLERQVRYLDEHQEIGVLGTSTYIIDGSGALIEERRAVPNPMRGLIKGNRLTHGSVMFRRRILDDVGYYYVHFKYAQDYDFWLRISKKYEIRNLDEPLYKLRMHGGALSATKIREQALCVLLAQRIYQRGAPDCDSYDPIGYDDLTRSEKIRFHNMVAYSHMQSNNIKLAQKEYTELLKLDPLNLENNLSLFVSVFSGRNGVLKVQNMYRLIRSKARGIL